jgi:hypothetical protein
MSEKSKACKMVLQAMDSVEDPNYQEILKRVIEKTKTNKAELELELDKYI